jgi:hypothetical protein
MSVAHFEEKVLKVTPNHKSSPFQTFCHQIGLGHFTENRLTEIYFTEMVIWPNRHLTEMVI